jgi:hypothetical protein
MTPVVIPNEAARIPRLAKTSLDFSVFPPTARDTLKPKNSEVPAPSKRVVSCGVIYIMIKRSSVLFGMNAASPQLFGNVQTRTAVALSEQSCCFTNNFSWNPITSITQIALQKRDTAYFKQPTCQHAHGEVSLTHIPLRFFNSLLNEHNVKLAHRNARAGPNALKERR